MKKENNKIMKPTPLPWYLKGVHKPLVKDGRVVAIYYIKMHPVVYWWRRLKKIMNLWGKKMLKKY